MHERRSAYSFYVLPQLEKIGRSLAFYVKSFLLMFLTALFSSMDKLSLNAKKDSIIDIQSKKSNKQQVNIGVDSSGIKQVESARFLAVHIDKNIKVLKKSYKSCLQQNCKTFWYTLSRKTLFTSRCYPESI